MEKSKRNERGKVMSEVIFNDLKQRRKVNEGIIEKRKSNRKRVLIKAQAERLQLKLQQREGILFEDKENPKKNQGKLTIEELRRCKGFETISESEGNEIIESLFQLALIVYNY